MSAISDTISVLHVDDEPDFADMVSTFLEREDDRFDIETAPSASEGLAHLSENEVDCIVSDYDMPDGDGIEFLETVREEYPDLPFILYTGKGSEGVASEAISAGITDYLQKETGTDQYAVLANRIQNAVERTRSQRERERQLDAIETAQEGISILDEDHHFVYVNTAYADLYGYDPEEMIGEHWELLYREADVPEIRNEILPAVEEVGHWHGTTIGLRADGSTFVEDHVLATTDRGELVCTVRDVTDREEQKRELQTERAIIEQALDALDDVFYVVDPDGTMRRWNDRLSEVTGYTDEEIADMAAAEFFPEDERERIASGIEEILTTGRTVLEADLLTAGGDRIPFEFAGRQLTDPDGEVIGVVGIGRDITERKEYERDLERIRRRYRAIFEDPNVLTGVLDTDGTLLETNRKSMEYVDATRAAVTGEPIWETPWWDEENRSLIRENVERAAEGEYVDYEADLTTPDGDPYSVAGLIRPVTDDAGHVVSLIISARDVTERKMRERDARQTREEYQDLINGMNDTAWVISPDEQIKAVNDAAVEVMGYSRDELLAMTPHEFDAGLEDGEITELITHMPEDEIQVFETVHETSDGEHIPVEISSSLITYRGETAILSIARDISDRKEREKRLEQFASIVSHDLRNPLNVAQGRLELVDEECDSEHLEHVVRAHERMNALIDDLLTLAREGGQLGDTEAVDLADLVGDCWQNVETTEVSIRTNVDRRIEADQSRVQQLLENLFRNAVEHGGEEVTVGELADGFYVEDDGPGIPADERDKVFEAGYSTGENGTGFGLAIVEQVADAHGWAVRLTDGEDGGARFEITGVTLVE